MKNINYLIGIFSKYHRMWYYKTHNFYPLWGLLKWFDDNEYYWGRDKIKKYEIFD